LRYFYFLDIYEKIDIYIRRYTCCLYNQHFKEKYMTEEKKVVYMPFYKGVFSQWYRTKFQDPELPEKYRSHVFTSCEQFMIFCKALLFQDTNYARTILREHSCRKIKVMGRNIRGFSNDIWKMNREDIVTRGNYLKFSQDPELKKKLLATQGKHLVEASTQDLIWGIGLSKENRHVQNPVMWRGLNLLGKCLDRAREIIILNDNCKSLVDSSYDSDSNDQDLEEIFLWAQFKSQDISPLRSISSEREL
jgi:ribA/ribD-fused uncharacterized protein